MRRQTLLQLGMSALLVAVGLFLPEVLRLKGLSEQVLLPMQIPVALAGFLLPMNWAVACAVLVPVLNSAVYDIPFLTVDLPLWVCQLIALAAFANFYYTMLGKNIYVAILCAEMLSFVFLFCAASIFCAVSPGGMRALPYFRHAVTAGWPGILLQILVVPPCVMLIEKLKAKWEI